MDRTFLAFLAAMARRGRNVDGGEVEARGRHPQRRARTFADTLYAPHQWEISQNNELKTTQIVQDIRRSLGRSSGALRSVFQRSTGQARPSWAAEAGSVSGLIPNALVRRLCVAHRSRLYNTMFFNDGRFAVAGSQDAFIHIFRTGGDWVEVAAIEAQDVAWTVTSVDVAAGASESPRLMYATMSPLLHLMELSDSLLEENFVEADVSTRSGTPAARPPELTIDLSSGRGASRAHGFGVYQARFAPGWAGSEAIAACSDNRVRVVDISSGKVVVNVIAHADDINAVCFADPAASANVFASASDDGMVKIWDRRALQVGEDPSPQSHATRASSYLPGHLGGITSLSPRGDGVYLITNAKDQSAKLWDLRRCATGPAASEALPFPHPFDYRYQEYPGTSAPAVVHPRDMSVATFRGHCVLQTLIKAHFSPAATTGGRYIYSGSSDGRILVWDLLQSGANPQCCGGGVHSVLRGHHGPVRDVSWHPSLPLLLSASFDGSLGVWEYNGCEPALQQRTWRINRRENAAAAAPPLSAERALGGSSSSESDSGAHLAVEATHAARRLPDGLTVAPFLRVSPSVRFASEIDDSGDEGLNGYQHGFDGDEEDDQGGDDDHEISSEDEALQQFLAVLSGGVDSARVGFRRRPG